MSGWEAAGVAGPAAKGHYAHKD